MLNLEDMYLFVLVAELKSFTAAGDREQYPKSTISRRVRKLEDHLGVRLFDRTTRSINLTESGEMFYKHAVQILNDVEDTEQLLSSSAFQPTGHLRICAPDEFISLTLEPIIMEFALAHPRLCIDVVNGTVGQNLLGDRLDLMIHIDDPEDSSFIARPLTSATTNYYASPAYIELHGEPAQPEDVLHHRCVVEHRNQRKNVNHWPFRVNDKIIELPVEAQYSADTSSLSRKFVEHGLGIGMLPDHSCRDSIASGKLVKLFGGHHEINHNLYAIYPSRRHVPAKVKVFLDYIVTKLPDKL